MTSLSDFAEIIARQFWRMALVGALCAGAAAWALLTMTPVFEARTLLLYKLGREYLFVPDVGEVGPGVRAPDPGDLQQIVGAEMQIIANRDLRRRFVAEFGVERIFPGMIPGPEAEAMAADALGGMVSVGLIPNTLMVDVRVRHPDPAVAADMANTLVSLYFERRNAVFAGRDADYYRSRLVSAQAAVDRLADETRRLLDGGDPLSFETERGILVARQATLQSQIAEDEALKTGLAVRLASLESDLATLPDTVVEYRTLDRNPVVSAAQSRIVTLAAQREATTATLGGGHPTVQALTREIDALQRSVADEPAEIEVGGRIATNPIRARAEGEVFALRAQFGEVEARLAHLGAELARNAAALSEAAAVLPDLTALQRAADLQAGQLAEFDARLRDVTAEAAQGGTPLGSVRVLERATPPIDPVGAPKSVRLLVSLILGGALGFAAGMAAHFSRPTILTAGMFERRLGAPVLAEITRRSTRARAPRYAN